VIVYVTHSSDREAREALCLALYEKGHAVMLSPVLSEADNPAHVRTARQLIARCDAIVSPGGPVDEFAALELDYAESLGVDAYSGDDRVPELHPTEVKCPEQVTAMSEVFGRLYRLHLAKNADYSSNNVTGPGEVGFATRLWDKSIRLANLAGADIVLVDSDLRPALYMLDRAMTAAKKLGFKLKALVSRGKSRRPRHEPFDDNLLDSALYFVIWYIFRKGRWGK
jgi:hypothetical protein